MAAAIRHELLGLGKPMMYGWIAAGLAVTKSVMTNIRGSIRKRIDLLAGMLRRVERVSPSGGDGGIFGRDIAKNPADAAVSTDDVAASITEADAFTREAYLGVLGRAPENAAIERWRLRYRAEPRHKLLAGLVSSPEFQRNYLHGLVRRDGMKAVAAVSSRMALSLIPDPLHQLRIQLVTHHLPRSLRVLDLGGASADEQGGLLSMGYRGAEEITIIDLPPDVRFKPAMEKSAISVHHGTTVRYAYHSMADLERYPDEYFDFVWSGQTMEHIALAEGDRVFRAVPRILKPGGIFALDTPNRTATRLAVGDDGFIHAEHAHEYRFEEMMDRHVKCGLSLIQTKGLIDCRRSLAAGYLLPDEIISGEINDSPATSFVFFASFRKPN